MDLVTLVKGIKENEHAKVLIVGAMRGNFPEEYWHHPQIVLWRTGEWKPLPNTTKLVLTTRFLNHGIWGQLQKQCAKMDVPLVGTLGTGEIKRLLGELVSHTPLRRALAELSREAEVINKGVNRVSETQSLSKWIEARANFSLSNEPGQKGVWIKESRRLYELAKAEGRTTTVGSIATALRKIRVDRGAPMEPRRGGRQRQQVNVAVRGVQSVQRAVPDQGLLTLVNEALAALSLVKEHLQQHDARKRALLKQFEEL